MIIVLTPTGGLLQIKSVQPVVEERVIFNGAEQRLVQVAKDNKQTATGLYFQVEANMQNVFVSNNFFIGNLKPVVVNDILHKLLADGHFDFAQFEYQKKCKAPSEYIYDEGKSLPYFIEGTLMPTYTPFNYPFDEQIPKEICEDNDDDLEDISSMSDEELRSVIYELEDMTMAELASMSRVDLEKEYKNIKVGDLDE